MAGLVAAHLTADGTVKVAAAPNTVESRRLCASLTAALPRQLGRLKTRAVDGDRRLTAAWGDPAITLRCGVIATPSPLGDLATLDGVDWAPVTGERTVTWTTVGRVAAVQVQMPRSYDSQGPLLAGLSPAITKALPAR